MGKKRKKPEAAPAPEEPRKISVDGRVIIAAPAVPIISIDQLAEHLGLTRDWINRRWLHHENPPPCFRDGDCVFFNLEQLNEWSKTRAAPALDTDPDA